MNSGVTGMDEPVLLLLEQTTFEVSYLDAKIQNGANLGDNYYKQLYMHPCCRLDQSFSSHRAIVYLQITHRVCTTFIHRLANTPQTCHPLSLPLPSILLRQHLVSVVALFDSAE